MSRARFLGALLITSTGLAVAAGHSVAAGTVALDRACYAPGDVVTETGAGFSPAAGVLEDLSLIGRTGSPVASFQAPVVMSDANGSFTRGLRVPKVGSDRDRREVALSAFTDQALGSASPPVTIQWTLSSWGTEIPEWSKRISLADPSKSMLVDTYGWTTAGRSVYAHYYRATTFIRTAKLGALTGPCGDFKRRVRQFPFKKVKPGEWSVFISTSAVLNKASDPWFRFKVRVPKSKARL
jgi:hypothetical protein